jgi:aldose 1-epimerase
MSFETIITEESGHSVITLVDATGGCEAEIYTFGGLLNAFRVLSKKESVNLVDGFSSVNNAKENITNGFKSTKLSPFVCRMQKGKYNFRGQDLTIQKYFLAGHAIHGLIYDAAFKIIHREADHEKAGVTLEYQYEGTDKGYPFPYRMIIHWQLETGNKLTVATTVSHENPHAIPMADGWHPYFALGGSVDEWLLQFDSHTQLEYDADLLPTGKKFEDKRFRDGGSLQNIVLDNSFELDSHVQPKCVLQNDAFRLTITPALSYPILQVYIPPHRKSIAIENLSGAPDNFNNGMGLILLMPGENKIFSTSYQVTSL